MTAKEAILILEHRIKSPFIRANSQSLKAMQLGIEALKEWQKAKDSGQLSPNELLRGETKE